MDSRPLARRPLFWVGLLIGLTGLTVMSVATFTRGVGVLAVIDFVVGLFGWGPFLLAFQALSALLHVRQLGLVAVAPEAARLLAIGSTLWVAGWALGVYALRTPTPAVEAPSAAVGAPLNPRLAGYRDFYWRTLFAYGGGMLVAELTLVVLQTLLAGGVTAEGQASRHAFQLDPINAFLVSLAASCLVAFAAGFFGAARAKRLSAPEATIGVLYFGAPIPALLTALSFNPGLQLTIGYRLREVTYLAGLLGRPELAYWLVFALLVIVMVLGITSGFVATGSGRLDLRAGFELFVARRHVYVFRWRFLLGLFVVLVLLVIPPLLIWAIVRAADAAVERTRIRASGLSDPLQATRAMHEARGREQSPTAMMTALSVGGVGVGVMALVIVLSVMSGFEADLTSKILGTNAHVLVKKFSDDFTEYGEVMKKVRQVPGVIGETPFAMREVMLSSEGDMSGTLLKGIDPATVGQVTDLPKTILPGGSMEYLDHPEKLDAALGASSSGKDNEGDTDPMIVHHQGDQKPLPGILLGKELAGSLRVAVGDRITAYTAVQGEMGPQGPVARARQFRVAGIFYTGMYEFDSKFAYIKLEEAESFLALNGVTGVELKVADVDDARRIARTVLDKLDGYPYRTTDWGELNKNLFSALRLEKLVMAIILSIIVVVAAGLIVATVIMLVLEKRKEISILKALGVSDAGIVKIFLAEGLQIGIVGSLLGLAAGLVWCFIVGRGWISLDPEVYYIEYLPVKVEPFQTALSVVIAILVSYLASIYPALKASRVEPVEGLKAE